MFKPREDTFINMSTAESKCCVRITFPLFHMAQRSGHLEKEEFPVALTGHETSMSPDFLLLQCFLLEKPDGQKCQQKETTTLSST